MSGYKSAAATAARCVAEPGFRPFPPTRRDSATAFLSLCSTAAVARILQWHRDYDIRRIVSRQKPLQWENRTMDALKGLKNLIAALTEIGLMLLALAIVAALLVGGNVPFFGSVVTNITNMVKDLGSNGLVGLIALGLILWLFSKRTIG